MSHLYNIFLALEDRFISLQIRGRYILLSECGAPLSHGRGDRIRGSSGASDEVLPHHHRPGQECDRDHSYHLQPGEDEGADWSRHLVLSAVRAFESG